MTPDKKPREITVANIDFTPPVKVKGQNTYKEAYDIVVAELDVYKNLLKNPIVLKTKDGQLVVELTNKATGKPFYYAAECRELERLEAASAGLVKTLESCKGAMTYAYEDHTDQYYLNVKNLIEASVAAYKLATEKEK